MNGGKVKNNIPIENLILNTELNKSTKSNCQLFKIRNLRSKFKLFAASSRIFKRFKIGFVNFKKELIIVELLFVKLVHKKAVFNPDVMYVTQIDRLFEFLSSATP
jgi:hypothetical protein